VSPRSDARAGEVTLATVAILREERGEVTTAESYGASDVRRVWGRCASLVDDALGGGWLGSRSTGRVIGVAYSGPAEGEPADPWVHEVHDLEALVRVSELLGFLTGLSGDWHDATDIVGPAYCAEAA
jgi:hypothetical protein